MSNVSSNDNFSKYFTQETNDGNNMSQSASIPMNITRNTSETETALESKFRRTTSTKFNNHYISSKNIPKFRKSLQGFVDLDNKAGQTLMLREMPKITQEEFDKLKASITNNEYLDDLYKKISSTNCNFKNVDSGNSIGGLTPLTYLVESSFSMSTNKAKEINDKYNMLKPYIHNYRTINGDGNCFYRAVMFRYLEILVLNKQIEYLQNVIYDVYNSLKSEEIQARLVIGNVTVKPTLAINLLILITELLKKGEIILAHNTLVKSFSTCRIFDYAIILYFRYLLYDYIKKNEEKNYIKSFPVKLGNLLPSKYETEDGKFLYESFYTNYLLKFYTDAEKIVIYLTPFVLGIPLNVIIFDDNEEEILQNFKWEEGKGLNITDEINLLNRKNHYEIVYSLKDNEKYKKIFEIYENNKKSVVLCDIEKYLKAKNNDNNTNVLIENLDQKDLINNPKTMVIQRNNLNKYNIDNNKSTNNFSNTNINHTVNRTILNSGNANQNIVNKNNNVIINNNDINQYQKKELNQNVEIKQNNKNISNIGNNMNQNQKYNNNIKNINNNNIPINNIKNTNNNNNNQINHANQSNNMKNIPINKNPKNNLNPKVEIKYPKPNNQIIPQNNIQSYNHQNDAQNKIYVNNPQSGEKNCLPPFPQNNPNQKVQTYNSKYPQNYNPNNRNIQTNQKQNVNNMPKDTEVIGLKTPGNEPLSKNSGNIQGFQTRKGPENSNQNIFKCKNCQAPIFFTGVNLCQKCFKKQIIDETYSSYLQCLDQNYQYKPEQMIYANIKITNVKNEEKNINLNNALDIYNKIFPNDKFGKNNVVLELKKRICIACLNEIQSDYFIELPCKCRICCKEHLNGYFVLFQDFTRGFVCRCKELYSREMMMQLAIIKELNYDILSRVIYFFQNKLDSCCCICRKSIFIGSQSNNLISLDKPIYNKFLQKLRHFFCQNCCVKNINSEFDCKICQIKHFFNT